MVGATLAIALGSIAGSNAETGPAAPVLVRAALPTASAAHAVLVAITRAGGRLVAVGERGIIVLSDDGGRSWRQAQVPVSVTLTAIAFPTHAQGWAVGHSGVILHSVDGGEHWTKQLDGIRAAKLALDEAEANMGVRPSSKARADLEAARQLITDGPDKPFLFVNFRDARNGLAGGAYGLLFETADAGEHWHSLITGEANPDRRHIYAAARFGDTVYLAGEQGFLARSDDGGRTYARLRSPSRGTFFVAATLPSGEFLVAGLVGGAFSSSDRGMSFRAAMPRISPSFTSLMLSDGNAVLTSDAGTLLLWRITSYALVPLRPPMVQLPPLAGIAAAPDHALVTVGLGGAIRLEIHPAGV